MEVPPSPFMLRQPIYPRTQNNGFTGPTLLFNLILKLGCSYQLFINVKRVACVQNFRSTTRSHVQIVKTFLYKIRFLSI